MWKLGEIDNKGKRKIKFGYNWDKHIIYCPNTDNFESEKDTNDNCSGTSGIQNCPRQTRLYGHSVYSPQCALV